MNAEHSVPSAAAPSCLLVSVRSAVEADAALRGGADLIDVKEPRRGPLGRAEDAILAEVVRRAAGRRPLSAALGELDAETPLPTVSGLTYCKWGLAGWKGRPEWRQLFLAKAELARQAGSEAVVVAYADWQQARAPSVEEVGAFARERPGSLLLVDTWKKEPHAAGHRFTLLDWLAADELARLCERCRQAGVRIALAGSLGPEQIRELQGIRPHWFAVRGAACEGGRDGVVSARRVADLVRLLTGAARRES